MVRIVSDGGANRKAAFQGFVVEGDWKFSAAQAGCRITCAGMTQRLLRDQVCVGRHMLGANGSEGLYRTLPCRFNAHGRPNCSDKLAGTYACGGSAARAFTYDGDPDGTYWTGFQAVVYLLAVYNRTDLGAATWSANPTFSAALSGDTRPVYADCEWLSAWDALAAVCDAAGYDAWEAFTMNGDDVVSTIHVAKRDEGTLRQLRHQALPAEGPANLDDTTNLFSASIAESVASCVTAPLIVGSAPRRSCYIRLYRAWDKKFEDQINRLERFRVILPADKTNNYHRYYVVGGAEHKLGYENAYRRWDANTDGRYTHDLNLAEADVASACGFDTGTWPRMPYPPLPNTDLLGHDLPHRFELWMDGLNGWQPTGGFQVMADRLGIYINTENLADWEDHDMMTRLLDDPNAAFYLACEVASPQRKVLQATRRASAGTAFTTVAAFDRGILNENIKGTAKSKDAVGAKWKEEYPIIAAMVQDVCEDRMVEASFELPWPEVEISLGDRLEKIEGIEYSLRSNSGAASRWPRVVGIELNLDVDSYNTQYTLSTDRKMPVR
jgi:hypothetical protein